jgi:hypothetical protein
MARPKVEGGYRENALVALQGGEILNSHKLYGKAEPPFPPKKVKMHNLGSRRSRRFKSSAYAEQTARAADIRFVGDRLQSEQFAQPFGLGAAYGDFGLFLVIHSKLVGAFEPGNNFLDAVDIHEIAPVRTPEKIRIEAVE